MTKDQMSLNGSTEDAIALATEAASQLLLMEHRANARLPGNPHPTIAITYKMTEEDFSEASIDVHNYAGSGSEYQFINPSGLGKGVDQALASLLYCLQLELEDRIKNHTEMVEKLKAAIGTSVK